MNRAILLHITLLAAVSLSALAQTRPADPYAANYPPESAYQQQQPLAGPRLSSEELSNLVAPIALYPDMLLSQVLAASTYPAEIVQAQQWMDGNRALRGQQLVEAAQQQNWDPSVQALVAFPDVMNLLTRDIQWTTDLGNAFLTQQADLMDAIQRLRIAARDNGRLTNTLQQRLNYEQENGQNAIVIQSANPQVVYPPVYNPEYVWGPPVSGAYPSLGYPDTGEGIVYGMATFLGALFSGLSSFGGWGWGLSWLTHGLFLNNLFFSHFGFHGSGGYGGFYGGNGYGYATRSAWVHDPGHRLGVPYVSGYAGTRYASRAGSRGWSRFGSQTNGSKYDGHSYYTSPSYFGSGYGGSNYRGSSRQMEAYRSLSQSASRVGAYNSYGSGYRAGGGYDSHGSDYRTGSFYNSPSHYSTPGYGYSHSYASAASQGGYRGAYSGSYSRGESSGRGWFSPSSHYSAPRSSHGSFSSSHFSAPKSSGHFGGGGHSKGGGHFGGGGHSHGGSHKRR